MKSSSFLSTFVPTLMPMSCSWPPISSNVPSISSLISTVRGRFRVDEIARVCFLSCHVAGLIPDNEGW